MRGTLIWIFLFSTCLFVKPLHALVPLSVTSNYASYSAIADHRNPAGTSEFSLSTFDFIFGLRAFNSNDYRANLRTTIPLRTLQMTTGASANAGSELGGYQISWNQTLWDFLGWDLSYAKRASPRLDLFEAQQSVETLVSLKTTNFLSPGFLVRGMAGPGIQINSALTPMILGKARLDAIWATDLIGKLAIGAYAQFYRRQRVGSLRDASLFTIQPQVAWELVRDLWISLDYTHALAKPTGFEQAMGDASLSGLYGDTFGFGISTAAF